ncbi:MAG: amidohydrolase family protein [Acetobacteraceae bacterium]
MSESEGTGAVVIGPIVDAHQHFWDLTRHRYPWLQDEPLPPFRYGNTRPLRRNYLPADYRSDCAGFTVAATVHVEAEWDPEDPIGEQRWLAALSARYGLPSVSVAQARLDREDVREVLAGLSEFPLVRGVRHQPRAAPSAAAAGRGAKGSMDDPRWRAGFALLARHDLSFDLQTPFWHADAARELARDFPETLIIIEHAFLPSDRSPEGLVAWRAALEKVAWEPNVSLQISGLGQAGGKWDRATNRTVIRDAIGIFGAGRTMFASNYPVDRLVAGFRTIYAGFRAAVADRPAGEQRALFHDNAARIYRIDADCTLRPPESAGSAVPAEKVGAIS